MVLLVVIVVEVAVAVVVVLVVIVEVEAWNVHFSRLQTMYRCLESHPSSSSTTNSNWTTGNRYG